MYPYLVTKQKIKVAVTASWLVALYCSVVRWPLSDLLFNNVVADKIGRMIVSTIVISCIVFMATSYVHQQNKIKTQQLPQEEVERFVKERKTLKTTVYVVGAVLLYLSPGALTFVHAIAQQKPTYFLPWFRTIIMSNSLLNPLIYSWRQKEMRLTVFRMSSPAVAAD